MSSQHTRSTKPRNLRSVEYSYKSGVCREVGALSNVLSVDFRGVVSMLWLMLVKNMEALSI